MSTLVWCRGTENPHSVDARHAYRLRLESSKLIAYRSLARPGRYHDGIGSEKLVGALGCRIEWTEAR